MSEAEQLVLPFDTTDISPNASKSDALPQLTIMALAEQLNYVDPAPFGAGTPYFDRDHYEAELEQAQTRHSWLEQADEYLRHGNYTAAISLLGYALDDIEHAGYYHTQLLSELRDMIELCHNLPRQHSMGHAAIAEIVALPVTAQPDEIVPPIAS